MNLYYNISEEYKFFLWLPAKTASLFNFKLFSENFNLICYQSDYNRNNIIERKDIIGQHDLNLFSGHENYILICSARNPFERLISGFMQNKNGPKGILEFRRFFADFVNSSDSLFTQGMKDLSREPDYFVRLEHLYDDLVRIPFVKESEFNISGELEKKCKIKENQSHYQINIRDYYTPDMIHLIYTTYYDYFNKLEYSPTL